MVRLATRTVPASAGTWSVAVTVAVNATADVVKIILNDDEPKRRVRFGFGLSLASVRFGFDLWFARSCFRLDNNNAPGSRFTQFTCAHTRTHIHTDAHTCVYTVNQLHGLCDLWFVPATVSIRMLVMLLGILSTLFHTAA